MELKKHDEKKGNGRFPGNLCLLLERISSVDPAQTIADARRSLQNSLGRIQSADGSALGYSHPAAAFVRDARNQSALELMKSYRELLIVLYERRDDELALRAMDIIAESALYTIDVAGVRSLAKLAGSRSPAIAKTDNHNVEYSVSVSDARTFLEIKINRFERALAAKVQSEGAVLAFVDEGLNKAADSVRDSFREIVMALSANPSDPVGLTALEIVASTSFTIKDKLAIKALLGMMETNPLSQGASSASLSAQGP